ncbi:MAG: hypothetical protein E7523_04455 [Ruminococcaceae bacterium]|nr:hypothetical protein [Oscillospiraceae bacterium]
MDYLTPAQIAEKWGVSRRSVRQYLAADRIPGVLHVNNRILIPADAEKPADLRFAANKPAAVRTTAFNPFVFTVGCYNPGEAETFLNSIEDAEKRTIGLAELAYYRGEADRTRELTATLTQAKNVQTQIGILLMGVVSSMLTDDPEQILNNYRILNRVAAVAANDPKFAKTGQLFSLYCNIIVHNTEAIVLPDFGVEAFAVEEALKPMAIYAFSRYLVLTGDVQRGIGLAEGALIMMKPLRPISAIYLALTISAGYISSGNWDRAEYYFRYAWSLAEPDGIIAPFAEFRGLLSGLVGKCLRTEHPAAYKSVMDLSAVYLRNWIFVHNALTGNTVSDKLTPTEFNVAMLAARGAANSDIADILNISVHSVRTHLRNIFNKLNVYSRKQLSKYVI